MWWHSSISAIAAKSGIRSVATVPGACVTQVKASTPSPTAVGLGVLAFTWVTQAPGPVATDLMPDFAAIAEIEECHHIAGEADYLLKIRARDMEHLGSVVRRVQTTANVFST